MPLVLALSVPVLVSRKPCTIIMYFCRLGAIPLSCFYLYNSLPGPLMASQSPFGSLGMYPCLTRETTLVFPEKTACEKCLPRLFKCLIIPSTPVCMSRSIFFSVVLFVVSGSCDHRNRFWRLSLHHLWALHPSLCVKFFISVFLLF